METTQFVYIVFVSVYGPVILFAIIISLKRFFIKCKKIIKKHNEEHERFWQEQKLKANERRAKYMEGLNMETISNKGKDDDESDQMSNNDEDDDNSNVNESNSNDNDSNNDEENEESDYESNEDEELETEEEEESSEVDDFEMTQDVKERNKFFREDDGLDLSKEINYPKLSTQNSKTLDNKVMNASTIKKRMNNFDEQFLNTKQKTFLNKQALFDNSNQKIKETNLIFENKYNLF